MTINFVCRSSKTSKKDGLTPLELYVIINGKRRYVSLNRRIDHKLFNLRKQIVRGDDQTNEYIEAIRMKCYSIETEMLKRCLLFTTGTFVYAFKNGIVYLDTLINSLKTYTTKLQRLRNGHFTTTHCWTLKRAVAYYGEQDQDGERHTALFVIKDRLSDDDCGLFVDWLKANHPSKM